MIKYKLFAIFCLFMSCQLDERISKRQIIGDIYLYYDNQSPCNEPCYLALHLSEFASSPFPIKKPHVIKWNKNSVYVKTYNNTYFTIEVESLEEREIAEFDNNIIYTDSLTIYVKDNKHSCTCYLSNK